MKSFESSFHGLFGRLAPGAPAIGAIEIPLFQRDYAQGRGGAAVERIRSDFLGVLHAAATGGQPVSLDFVYGDIDASGTLRPLDGQQRLTTLFLLHWYLAARADRLGASDGWKRLRYATRASARHFCERLVASRPPEGVELLSTWIWDQSWYRFTWRHDPTIQSMLVMLDAIHERFRGDDAPAAWERLVHPEAPAITFHLLATDQLGAAEELYIKMNSRGRPLTPFENFKARFEQTLERTWPGRLPEFAAKVDGAWADLLWRYRGENAAIDDECLRYFQFVTEVCEWRDGEDTRKLDSWELHDRAERTFGAGNPGARENIGFLFEAFDTWCTADIPAFFAGLFATAPSPLELGDTGRVVLFDEEQVDLFHACCRTYGEMRTATRREFTLQQTLLLYAALFHRLRRTVDLPRRLRVLRNLLVASDNEVRQERMPALLRAVERLVEHGELPSREEPAFNAAQLSDEYRKRERLAVMPGLERSLFQLEDHPLLRGGLACFDVAAPALERRARAFHQAFAPECWPALTGALLACGNYSRMQRNRRYFQLGSATNELPWRTVLGGADFQALASVRDVLEQLLDRFEAVGGEAIARLDTVWTRWLEAVRSEAGFDWRYYLVKYPIMRAGSSGLYVGIGGALGFDLCMLDGKRVSGEYRDPFLAAIHAESGVGKAVREPRFTGYETLPRWLRLDRTEAGLRCVEAGFELDRPHDAAQAEVFTRVCAPYGVDDAGVLAVSQVERDGRRFDTRDRVRMGADLVRALVNAGL